MSFVVGNFNFTILDETTAELAGFVDATGVTTLTNIPATATDPATSTTYDVVGIGANAFVDNTTLTTIVIPGTIRYTGRISFGTNSSVTSLTLGEGIQTIGQNGLGQSVCFASCRALTNLVIPASVTNIGEASFLNCSGLTNIRFNSTTTLPAINTNAFSGVRSGIIVQYNSSVTNSNSVTTQSGTQALSAFFNSPVLEPILPNSIVSGSTGSGSAVNMLYASRSSTVEISYIVDQTAYPSATHPNTWFNLSTDADPFAVPGTPNVNLGYPGTLVGNTYTFPQPPTNTFDTATGLMTLTFHLPELTTTLAQQYGTGFQLNSGTYYLCVFVANNDYSSILLVTSQPVTVENFPCFKEGSKILTDSGYKLVQNLRKGDLVKTLLNGYKPISLIGKREIYHTASEERIKDQLYKYSSKKTSDVFEDLVITGAHSVLVDDISEEQREKITEVLGKIYVTGKKYRLPACVDKRSSVYEAAGTYTIYHFALDCEDSRANYGVYANGLLVETCSKRYLTDFSNMELI